MLFIYTVELLSDEGMALLPFSCRDFFIAKTFLLAVTNLLINKFLK